MRNRVIVLKPHNTCTLPFIWLIDTRVGDVPLWCDTRFQQSNCTKDHIPRRDLLVHLRRRRSYTTPWPTGPSQERKIIYRPVTYWSISGEEDHIPPRDLLVHLRRGRSYTAPWPTGPAQERRSYTAPWPTGPSQERKIIYRPVTYWSFSGEEIIYRPVTYWSFSGEEDHIPPVTYWSISGEEDHIPPRDLLVHLRRRRFEACLIRYGRLVVYLHIYVSSCRRCYCCWCFNRTKA